MSEVRDDAEDIAASFGLRLGPQLPARSSEIWRAQRRGESLLLRRHRNLLSQGHKLVAQDLAWQARTRAIAAKHGWPTAAAVGEPIDHAGSWWTFERCLDGEHRALGAPEHAALMLNWHQTMFPLEDIGTRPGVSDPLVILEDEDAPAVFEGCRDQITRELLHRHLDRTIALAEGIDWSASPTTLVHGDLVAHNLLWRGTELTGVLDFEFTNVTRRITELTLTWRCRHDDLVHAVDRIAPLNDQEWRMLLVDWRAQALNLAAASLRRNQQPGKWELDALRRESGLSRQLENR